eukprot:6488069-Amphidinium_carterae.1
MGKNGLGDLKSSDDRMQVCKQISELHLILIEKKTIHRDDEFRLIQEKHRDKVMKAVAEENRHSMYSSSS